jgi:hypothetical protein
MVKSPTTFTGVNHEFLDQDGGRWE